MARTQRPPKHEPKRSNALLYMVLSHLQSCAGLRSRARQEVRQGLRSAQAPGSIYEAPLGLDWTGRVTTHLLPLDPGPAASAVYCDPGQARVSQFSALAVAVGAAD